MARKTPLLPPPPTHPDEPPFVCIEINQSWIPYVIGALRPMRYPEYWAGTLEENRTARKDANNLINQLAIAGNCMDDNCCPDVPSIVTILHQVSSDGSTLEMSVDNGETWVQDNTDPRTQVVSTPAPIGSVASNKCEAADNMVQGLMELQVQVSNSASGTGSLQEIALEVITTILALLLLPPVGAAALLVIVFGLIKHFLALGKANYDALFTLENWDRVRCALYCNLEEDGKITTAGFIEAKRQIFTTVPGDNNPNGAAANIVDLMNMINIQGLNLFAYTYQGSGADCSSCECVECELDYDFQLLPFYWLLSDVKGSWEVGANKGWKSTYHTHSDTDYYSAFVEITFYKPCFAGYFHFDFFITDDPNRNARGSFDKLVEVNGVKTWTQNGFNVSTGSPGAHSDTFVLSQGATERIFGVRFSILNVGKPVGHYINHLSIDNIP